MVVVFFWAKANDKSPMTDVVLFSDLFKDIVSTMMLIYLLHN
jgi:hypothetical protein